MFGNSVILWFIPIRLPAGEPSGDGVVFAVKERNRSGAGEYEMV